MTDINKKFSAKILLFGEYTVTVGSGALAIPYDEYSGYWDFGHGHELSKQGLTTLAAYVRHHPKLATKYNLAAFYKALDRGLYFASDIPSGYGLGSSGAVVAAFYDSYAWQKTDDPALLKHELSWLESAYHGASSGIDPLVSLLNAPVQIGDQYEISTPKIDKIDYNMFLLDTGISRQTGPLVSIFKSKIDTDVMFKNAVQQLILINKAAIQSYIMGDVTALFDHFDSISRIQYDFFGEMIPEPFRKIWETGLYSDAFKLKLCGAGGGGMLMGVFRDHTSFPDKLTGFKISFI